MTLSDISYDALKIAQRNSVIIEGFADSQKSNIRTIQSDLFEKIEEISHNKEYTFVLYTFSIPSKLKKVKVYFKYKDFDICYTTKIISIDSERNNYLFNLHFTSKKSSNALDQKTIIIYDQYTLFCKQNKKLNKNVIFLNKMIKIFTFRVDNRS